MIRNLFVTLLFTFGPMLLMFLLRNSVLLLKAWLIYRSQQREAGAEVIDITPPEKGRPSAWFIILTVLIGLFSAVLVWNHLQQTPDITSDYQPATMEEYGDIISGGKE